MPLRPSSLAELTRYWASFFGCPQALLAAPGTHVLPHAELEEYRGVYCFRRDTTALVSVPPDELDRWRTRLASLDAVALTDPMLIGRQVGAASTRLVGPASLAYADAATLRPLPVIGTRLLVADDESAHAALRAACSAEEWTHGGSDFGLLTLSGRFARGQLVALAGYEPWGEQIAHISIVTHPAYRGQGYGAEAVSLLAETLIARGMLVQYRTLRANTPSLRLGASLGFAQHAETLAIRLSG